MTSETAAEDDGRGGRRTRARRRPDRRGGGEPSRLRRRRADARGVRTDGVGLVPVRGRGRETTRTSRRRGRASGAATLEPPRRRAGRVAELIEDDRRGRRGRSRHRRRVEAAADHFAESVRGRGAASEPETSVAAAATEEVAIGAAARRGGRRPIGHRPRPAAADRPGRGRRGFGGPSWQEPTAIEVGADPERAGRRRRARRADGVHHRHRRSPASRVGVAADRRRARSRSSPALVVLFAQGEFYGAMQKHHHQPATARRPGGGGARCSAPAYYRGRERDARDVRARSCSRRSSGS